MTRTRLGLLGALVVATILISLEGCMRNTRLSERESAFGTGGDDLSVFHRIAEGDMGLGLRYPGFLIGIEKAKKARIGYTKERLNLRPDLIEGAVNRKRIQSYIDDPKAMFVSHLVEYSQKSGSGLPYIGEDIFFNAYETNIAPNQVYEEGYNAFVGEFRQRLRKDILTDKYSHILVYCMGWNTDQQESLRNFNSLVLQLSKRFEASTDGGNAFHPLVIGVSWPSEWRWPLFQMVGKVLSYPVKSNDADEIGVTWGNLLVNDILAGIQQDAKTQIPLVLIGHSFGARVVTRAAASGALLGTANQPPIVDLIVAIQGAFSVNRFIPKGGLEGTPYADFDKFAKKYLLTWSIHDTANPVAKFTTGAKHVGGPPGYSRSREDDARTRFEYFTAESDDQENALTFTPESTRAWGESIRNREVITYVDVSNFVRFEGYGRGGKAHADIFTWEVAELVRSALVETGR